MKRLFFYLLLPLLITFNAQGQNEKYTIYKHGGKVYKTNRYVRKTGFLKFKSDNNSYELPYLELDSIVSYEKNKKSKKIEPVVQMFIPISKKQGALMRVVERGKCTLFLWRYALGGGTSTNYYAYREGERTPKLIATRDLISPLNFIKDTSEYFSDCEALVAKIKNKDFKKKETPEMVRFYNTECN
ncbi:hypothetical protein GCM10011344_22230 [Dokdonia pacifica]|uniref:Uncharacterized protein n=1 Tax=Dokdonia pacifica TaxID=1627892 RepID=A0A238WGD0_9FLAO|nr:hypothetical protein [Dokdonia pacifica]GGG21011.1 hypothetical protein GCM10011344_22230 [Dokdonia pacifica]SNR45640.1 hypothetical protein SAMN06265376_1011055 [Dokdonia pacifica]